MQAARIAASSGNPERVRRRAPRFGRSVALLIGGTAAGQAITILASPLIARLYAPADFGVLAVLGSILSPLLVIASLRYEIALPIAKRESTAVNLLALCFAVLIGMCVLATVGIIMTGELIASATETPALTKFLWYIPVALLGIGSYNVLRHWMIRAGDYATVARTRFAQGIGAVSMQAGMGLATSGPVGLVAGALVGQASGVGALALRTYRCHARQIARVRPRRMYAVARQFKRFPYLTTTSGIVNTAGVHLTPLLLAMLYGPHVVGLFALGQRVIALPVLIVGQSFAQVYLGRASTLAHEAPEELLALFGVVTRRLVGISVLVIPLLVAFSPDVFALGFGERWREAGEFLRYLAPMILAQLVVSPVSQTINVIGRQDLQIAWDVGRLACLVAIFGVAHVLGLTPKLTIFAYGLTMFFAYVVLYFIYSHALRDYVARSR